MECCKRQTRRGANLPLQRDLYTPLHNYNMGDTDWELQQGVPQVEDPFIQQYLRGRDALIAEEQKRRHGRCNPCMVEADDDN